MTANCLIIYAYPHRFQPNLFLVQAKPSTLCNSHSYVKDAVTYNHACCAQNFKRNRGLLCPYYPVKVSVLTF